MMIASKTAVAHTWLSDWRRIESRLLAHVPMGLRVALRRDENGCSEAYATDDSTATFLLHTAFNHIAEAHIIDIAALLCRVAVKWDLDHPSAITASD
jgi:hypothetical protein